MAAAVERGRRPGAGSREGAVPGEVAGLASTLRRGLLVAAGVLCVALGLVGVFVPLLPTTPFLLLAAACFVRSSERLHRWLLENRLLGEPVRRYRNREGMPLSSKVATLALLWGTLSLSAWVAVPPGRWWLHLLLLSVGAGVTTHILRIRTRRGGATPAGGAADRGAPASRPLPAR